MSRAFTSDDPPEGAPVVPARAPLPDGVPNYVTPRGLACLRAEQAGLEAERATAAADRADEAERTRRLSVLDARLAALGDRLRSARPVAPKGPASEVRFGATVTLRVGAGPHAGDERRYTLVGVDEADAAEGRVAFTAPLARALVGKRVGETARLETAHGEEALTVAAIAYDAA